MCKYKLVPIAFYTYDLWERVRVDRSEDVQPGQEISYRQWVKGLWET
jgi:hypothetical protein